MRRFLLVIPLLLVAIAAHATTVTLQWTAPTQYTDGTTIPSTETLTTNVYQGATGAEVLTASSVTGLTWTSANLAPNSKVCFYVTENDVQQATTSAPTNEVCATIPAETPNAPTNLVIKLN